MSERRAMSAASRDGWKCSHCGNQNEPLKRKCVICASKRPPKRAPKHLAALSESYETYIALNGGEQCGVCGRGPSSRRLDRDHDHKTGKPRGLLCHRCNRALPSWVTRAWLQAADAYLARAA